MKPFQIQLLKKAHLHTNFSISISRKQLVLFIHLPHLSIEEKRILQKELFLIDLELFKLEDKINISYEGIGFNTNSVFYVACSKENILDFIVYTSFIKALNIIKKNYSNSVILGVKYQNQFGTFESLKGYFSENIEITQYPGLKYQSLAGINTPVMDIITQLCNYENFLQAIDK